MVAHSRDAGHSRTARRLNEPRPAEVVLAAAGVPERVDGAAVARVREEWRVVERWWTGEPLRRRYFDVVLETGEHAVVFLDEESGGWHRQRA